MHASLFRTILVGSTVAITTLSASAVTASVAAAASRSIGSRAIEPAVRAPKGSHDLGPLGRHATVSFDVYLNSRNAAGLAAYAAAVTQRHSATYGKYLARGEFARRYGATSKEIASVRALLRRDGLKVSTTSLDGLGLRVSGTAPRVDRAFSTTIERYRLANGTIGTAAIHAVRVPSSIAHSILAVIGLDNLVHATTSTIKPTSHIKWPATTQKGRSFASHPQGVSGAPAACPSSVATTQQGYGGITDDQVAAAYGVTPLYGAHDFGAGQTVAVYELEPFATSDVATFDECYFSQDNTSNITTTTVDGGPGAGYGSGEAALDIENVSALAPQAHIDVYSAPNSTSGALDNYGQIVANDTARVVTTSWGLCETTLLDYSPGTLDVEHLLFEQAAAQGQSVFASAGDDGADDCANHSSSPVAPLLSVDDPASQPYVVSVGGTTAISVSHPPVEQVWNDGAEGGAGGGGISSLWPMPSWQSDIASVKSQTVSTCGTGTSLCRTTPDVSAFADEYTGITISYGGSWYTIGGTSSSAPIWAALLAEVNASSSCTTNPVTTHGVGFVSPLLYEVGANPAQAAESFNDITTGNNDIFSTNHGAFGAHSGYDLASGFGTPNLSGPSGTGLAATLCAAAQQSTVSSLTSASPTSGSTVGGTHVTIKGTGFKTGSTVNVKGVSFGDYPAASFSVTSATTLVAVTPPAGVPELLGTAVPAGTESLIEVTFASGHVATGPSFSYLKSTGSSKLPTVLSVGPSGGDVEGGQTVSIYGTGFTGASAVSFGGVAATSFVVKSDSLIEAVDPAFSNSVSCLAASHNSVSGLCQSQVVVTTAQGASVTIPALKPLQGQLEYNNQGIPYAPATCKCEIYPTLTEFDYQAHPRISSITDVSSSPSAPLASPFGGDGFVIKGSGFNWMTLDYLTFGDPTQADSQNFNIVAVDYNEILAYSSPDPSPTPAGDSVAVAAVSQGGTTAGFGVQYGGIPKVTAISSTLLPSAGGTSITLIGQGFTGATDVEFTSLFGLPSTVSLNNFTVDSPTQITVLSPSLVPATYFVSVDNAYGNSSTYTVPESGAPASYQTLPYTLTNVTVTYPGGAAITSSTGDTCSIGGGCTLVLNGVNFGGPIGLSVYVGTQSADVIGYTSSDGVDTVTVTIPPAFLGVAGLQNVLLVTSNGSAPYTLNAVVTYTLS